MIMEVMRGRKKNASMKNWKGEKKALVKFFNLLKFLIQDIWQLT
jgi:plasmid rolling circle replication initiator protein Rep